MRNQTLIFTYKCKEKPPEVSKYKDNEVIGDWTKSITNRMYWCAASSPESDGDQIMVVRWKSHMEHICDKHDGCYPLLLDMRERHKKWFTPRIVRICSFM